MNDLPKRDESRDLYLDTFMICSGRELIERYDPADKAEFFGGVDVSHYVPVEQLEAAQRRIDELEQRIASTSRPPTLLEVIDDHD